MSCWIAVIIGVIAIGYVIIARCSAMKRRARLVRDKCAPYVNKHGQAVVQVASSDLIHWLEEHESFEIISIANVGHFIVIVYK